MVVLTSFVMPDPPIKSEHRNTRAVLDKKDLGLGTLYISVKSVSWKEQMGNGCSGFNLSYPHMTLHAISTDTNVYPRECIYVMIDTRVQVPGNKEREVKNDQSDDSDCESEPEYSELIFVPADPSSLQVIYDSLTECQALNPDPEDMDNSDSDGLDEVYEDADEEMHEGNSNNATAPDMGGGGDTEVDNLTDRLQRNSMQIVYDYDNGDQEYGQFVDAD